MLEVRETEYKGRGVFATEGFSEGDLVESSPVLLLNPEVTDEDLEMIGLNHYCYEFGNRTALALGFGSLFNHSKHPNMTWQLNEDEHTIEYYACRDIAEDEELTIDYGVEVWFDIEE